MIQASKSTFQGLSNSGALSSDKAEKGGNTVGYSGGT